MLTKRLSRAFCTTAFENFFESASSKKLKFVKQTGRTLKGSQVHIPIEPLSKEQVDSFLIQHNIKQKKLIFNVDYSHLIGMKRLVALEDHKKNVYKGLSEGVDLLVKNNPDKFISRQELQFKLQIFGITDPLFKEKVKKGDQNEIMDQIIEYYANNPQRGMQRLYQQYNIPKPYLQFIDSAFDLDNRIYFMGINQYSLRKFLCKYLRLKDMKSLFMECLKYNVQINGKPQDFHHHCKDYLWRNHFDFLQHISYQFFSQARNFQKSIAFGYACDFKKPQDYFEISMSDLKDQDIDKNKLEKNAILEVLFGNLMSKIYTNNPFPYLSANFPKLKKEDQQMVAESFNTIFKKYKLIKKKYLLQKIIKDKI